MKPLLLLVLPLLLVLLVVTPPGCQGIIISRCQMARIFRQNGLEGYIRRTVADWVCLAKHESNYNTRAVSRNKNGSSDYGIFQINSKYWCYDGRTAASTAASSWMTISRTTSNALSSSPWVAWKKRCRGKDLRPYVKGC